MIDANKLQKIILKALPDAPQETVVRIAQEVSMDAEPYIYELVRFHVAQEKEKAFFKNK